MQISEHAHTELRQRKRGSEPLSNVLDRILASYLESDANIYEQQYRETLAMCKMWKDKATEAEEKLKNREQMVFQQ